jgi:transposase
LQSLLHRHNLVPPVKRPFALKHRDWWLSLDLSPTERLRTSHDLDTLAYSREQLQAVDHELAHLTMLEPWSSSYLYLVQLPGFGLVVSMTVLAAIGDITRFPSPKHLVGYAGLGSSVLSWSKTPIRSIMVHGSLVSYHNHA